MGNFLKRIFAPFDFPLRVSGTFSWMVRNREIQWFSDFQKTCSHHLSLLWKFRNFSLNGEGPLSSSFLWFLYVVSLALLATLSAVLGIASETSRKVTTCIWKQFVCKKGLCDCSCMHSIAPMWKFQGIFYLPDSSVLTLNGSEIRPADLNDSAKTRKL